MTSRDKCHPRPVLPPYSGVSVLPEFCEDCATRLVMENGARLAHALIWPASVSVC